MVIKIPQHHDFPQPFRKKVLDKLRSSLPEWEICVPKVLDLEWSIVLSYLMSTNYRDKRDFATRLKSLTGNNENAKLVSKSVRRFNPFRNRCSCFYDEVLKTVVNDFRKNLNWDKLSRVSDKLTVASKALECPILLINDYAKSENYRIFKNDVKRTQTFIVLIAFSFEDFNERPTTVYNFMIDNAFGLRMKKAALHYYLKETDVPKKMIQMLTDDVAKEDIFIKAALNSKYENAVLEVYKSPYVVSKLIEAGYEMDPRAKDSDGFSGLFHALTLKNQKVLYKLYYFAVDDCCKTEISFRNPDPNIVSNLQYIEDLLQENISKLKDSKSLQQNTDMKMKLKELLRLNRFLIEFNRKNLQIKNRLNYYESNDIVFEANKRRDIIVSLLDTYKKFFNYEEKSSLFPLDDYIFHKDYYLSVDIVAATIFFDNIIFLKERLMLDNDKQFSEIESSFFFFTLCNLAFGKAEFVDAIKALTFYSSRDTTYIFPLMHRFDNLYKVNSFSKILHDIDIKEDNVVTHIPESEILSILHSHPIIKNFLEMTRVVNYIRICKSVRVMGVKSVLVIERVLQVIGECLAPEKKDDYSFKRFLSLCLPKEVAQILRRLRHVLTHLKGHAFPSKVKCEKNISLFRSILKEIHGIDECFKPVYRIITLSCIIDQYEVELQRIKQPAHLISPALATSTVLTTEITSNNLRTDFLKRIRPNCRIFLETALINLKNEIEKEYLSSMINVEDVKHRIIYLLWPIKWFLELLQQCEINDIAILLNSLTNLESCSVNSIGNLKSKTDTFIKGCFDLLPSISVVRKRNRANALKSLKHVEYFMKVLKGFVFLSEEEKDEIRKEVPDEIKKQVLMKNRLIQCAEEGFTLEIDVYSAEFNLTYLSRKKMKDLQMKYESKDLSALTILKSQDPIAELEEIFVKNSAEKKKYDKLCETMQFSEKTRKTLSKLVAGQRKKIPANNLINLLDRIQLLKAIIIDEDEEIQRLWLRIKRETSRQLIEEKIVRRYLKDLRFQTAVEMLLFDCMILHEGVKLPENLWIKSSKLFQGINMRNIISHGNPLVENLCLSLDPQELPSEIIKKILILIRGEDAIKAILQLYERVHNDFTKFSEVINSSDHDGCSELRIQITDCKEWKNYALLLPDNHREKVA